MDKFDRIFLFGFLSFFFLFFIHSLVAIYWMRPIYLYGIRNYCGSHWKLNRWTWSFFFILCEWKKKPRRKMRWKCVCLCLKNRLSCLKNFFLCFLNGDSLIESKCGQLFLKPYAAGEWLMWFDGVTYPHVLK